MNHHAHFHFVIHEPLTFCLEIFSEQLQNCTSYLRTLQLQNSVHERVEQCLKTSIVPRVMFHSIRRQKNVHESEYEINYVGRGCL